MCINVHIAIVIKLPIIKLGRLLKVVSVVKLANMCTYVRIHVQFRLENIIDQIINF